MSYVDDDREPCRELIIVPPHGAAFDDPGMLRQIKETLDRAYPEYRFMVSTDNQFRDDAFTIIPVLGSAGGSEGRPLGVPPPMQFMRDLGEFLYFSFVNRPGSKVQ
jgi:hypothetical protein